MKWVKELKFPIRHQSLDLSKISYWSYEESMYLREANRLTVLVDGNMMHFADKEADEIYKMLTDEKELLKS